MIDKAFLEGIGITDADTVKQIADTYAADIQAEKDAAAAVQTQLDTANNTIQSYKDMDIDGIKASVEDYKQKWEKSEADRKAFEHRTKLSQYVKGLGLKDDVYEKHVIDLLTENEVKFDGDKLIGGDDALKSFRESHANAFADTKPKPEFVDSAQGNTSTLPDDDEIRRIMGLK